MLQYSQLFFYDLHLHLDLYFYSHPPFQPPCEKRLPYQHTKNLFIPQFIGSDKKIL